MKRVEQSSPKPRSVVRLRHLRSASTLLLIAAVWSTGLAESSPGPSSAWQVPHLAPDEEPDLADFPPLLAEGGGAGADTRDCGAPWRSLRDTRLWNILLDIYRLPGTDHFWAVGNSRFGPDGITLTGGDPLVCRTASGTVGWEVLPVDVDSEALPGAGVRFQSVRFASPLEGWAAGQARLGVAKTAVIYRSEDGGAHWSLVYESPVCLSTEGCLDHIIVDLEFVDEHHGWASGAIDIKGRVAILHTDDGGRTWRPQSTGVDASVSEVDFLDRDVGFAVARGGYTLRTADGGHNWEVVSRTSSILSNGLRGLDFRDSERGFGVNAGGLIVRTLDGGVSWELVRGGGGDLWDVRFADEMNGWAVGGLGLSAYTRDGGETWQSSVHVGRRGELRACVPIDGDTVFVVGNWGTINYTNDAGFSWQDVEGPGYITSADLTDVDFVDEKTGWIVGQAGISHTRDGGATWVHQGEPIWASFHAVDFVNRRVGWTATDGEIWRTTDGGERWEVVSDVDDSAFDFDFVDERLGWACGARGSIIRTSDGGVEWEPQDSGTDETLHNIDFFDRHVGWAVGSNGTILRTIDGGTRWESAREATGQDLYDVRAVGPSTAFTRWSGSVIGTRDGGVSWRLLGGGRGHRIRGLHFFDEDTGCATGGGLGFGFVNCTEDGGRTWRECSVPDERIGGVRFGRRLHAVFVASPDVRYAIGEKGAVLKFDRRDPSKPRFVRADCNGDGTVDVSDAISTLGSLFLGEGEPGCDDACDANDDGKVDISDPIATLGVLFLGQGTIPRPGMRACGADPSDDALGCEVVVERCR